MCSIRNKTVNEKKRIGDIHDLLMFDITMCSLYILALLCADFGQVELRIPRPTHSQQLFLYTKGEPKYFPFIPPSLETVVLSSIHELLCYSSVGL